MPTLQLSLSHLETVKSIIKKIYPHAVVWAYGSRVNGDCHEGSDLDLVLIDFGTEKGNISLIRAAFSDSNIPILIDIRCWKELPLSFQKEIKKQYVPILP